MKTGGRLTIRRTAALAAVTALGLGAIIGSGGGGGGGGFDGGDDTAPTTLDVYDFALFNSAGTPNPLTLGITVEGETYAIRVDFGQDSLNGSYTVASGDYTVSGGSTFRVDTDLAAPLLGFFDVTIIEDIGFGADGDFPDAGVWEVSYGIDTIRATVVDLPSPGVELRLNNGEPEFYDWATFEEIGDLNDTFPEWQQVAAGALLVLGIALEQADLVVGVLELIDDELAAAPLVRSCDAFTGSPPAGVLAQGESVLTWLGSGEVSPGDDFNWSFEDCWLDDATDDIDVLLRGSLRLSNWTEVVDDQNRLVRIGFEPFEGQGGVEFDALSIEETVEAPPGTFSIPGGAGSVQLFGGFAIVFFEPST